MRKYTVRFWNDVSKEVYEVWELQREKITKRDYDNILSSLFEMAAESIDNRSLFADIYYGGIEDLPAAGTLGVITVACETMADYPTINANIFINSVYRRTMNIAD